MLTKRADKVHVAPDEAELDNQNATGSTLRRSSRRTLSLDSSSNRLKILVGQPQPQVLPQPSPLFPGSPLGHFVEVQEDTYEEVAPGITKMIRPTLGLLHTGEWASTPMSPSVKEHDSKKAGAASPHSYAIRWQEVHAESLTADVLQNRRNTLIGFESSLSEAVCRLGAAIDPHVVIRILKLDPESVLRSESNPRWGGNYPLHFAIERGCSCEVVRLLLGADGGRYSQPLSLHFSFSCSSYPSLNASYFSVSPFFSCCCYFLQLAVFSFFANTLSSSSTSHLPTTHFSVFKCLSQGR